MLTSCDVSSLVIDSLCDQASSQKVAIGCFYFDFAARKEPSLASMLGALLKQIVSGLEEMPEEIAQAYEDQKTVIGGRGPQLADIVEMLRTASSRKPIFICIDALDECVAAYWVKLLDSLDQILQGSPGAWMFVTGRACWIVAYRAWGYAGCGYAGLRYAVRRWKGTGHMSLWFSRLCT